MSGQMKLYSQEDIDNYIEKNNIYERKAEFYYDLRKYLEYIKLYNLRAEDIAPEILDMFWTS